MLPLNARVAQGAIVLNDIAIRDMKLEGMTRVLCIKVGGSLSLDRLFYGELLDFFVSFSLAASVVGHPG